jgi:hypothetical protein
MARHIKSSPAERIHSAFGGAMEVSRATGITFQEVYRWAYPKSKKGCGGQVPAKHQASILKAAKRLRLKLKAVDLVDTP